MKAIRLLAPIDACSTLACFALHWQSSDMASQHVMRTIRFCQSSVGFRGFAYAGARSGNGCLIVLSLRIA